MYEILYNASGADRVEPVSVDEAYLEFIVPSRFFFSTPPFLSPPVSLALDNDASTNDKYRNRLDNDNNCLISPSHFGEKKAKELRERILLETGCTAR